MRILLDECVPAKLSRALPGHEVTTVQRMRWAGIRNGMLLRLAAEEFDVFLTLDRSMRHQHPPVSGLAVITLHVRDNSVESVVALAEEILGALQNIMPGDSVHLGTWRV